MENGERKSKQNIFSFSGAIKDNNNFLLVRGKQYKYTWETIKGMGWVPSLFLGLLTDCPASPRGLRSGCLCRLSFVGLERLRVIDENELQREVETGATSADERLPGAGWRGEWRVWDDEKVWK